MVMWLQMMAKGRDVSEFYPDVVRNVIVKAVEVKKLVYNYLVHHAVCPCARMGVSFLAILLLLYACSLQDASPTCRELALLAINSFQRDLRDSNQVCPSFLGMWRAVCGCGCAFVIKCTYGTCSSSVAWH